MVDSNCKSKLKNDHEKYISLLKLKSPELDTELCCDFCQCDCCCTMPTPVKSIKCKNGRKKKIKKSKRSKSLNKNDTLFVRDCSLMKDLYQELSMTPQPQISSQRPLSKSPPLTHNIPLDPWPNEIQLCESMKNLCLSPTFRRAYCKIPVHDQKILNRMARSRSEKAHLNENAWLANKFWENEKYERRLLKYEQEIEYKQAIREKQNYDYQMTKARIDALSKRDLNELKELRETLIQKENQLAKRLKHVKLDKSIMQCQRRQEEFRKSEAVQLTQEEQYFEEKLRAQEIANSLENRLARADCIRQQYLNAYTKRLRHDNYMEQIQHEEHFKETENFEKFKREQLQRKILHKSYRTKKFIDQKRRNLNQLAERAKISASLRDLVRRSVSPDGFQFYSAGAGFRSLSRQNRIFDRPISNLSFQSCVRLG